MTKYGTWGTPVSGTKSKITVETELDQGDNVIFGTRYDCRIDIVHGYDPLHPTSEKEMLDDVMQKTKERFWEDLHFDLRYAKVSVEKFWQTPLSVAFHVDVQVHCYVQFASPLTGAEIVLIIGAVATLIGVLIKVGIVYMAWRVIEPLVTGEGVFAGGLGSIFIIIAVLIALWILLGRRKK